jgi:spermidine/putrescine-binding protein
MKDFMTGPDGTAWLVPFEWGNTMLTYNPEKVAAEDVRSLRAFADPKFEGRVSIGDNVDDAYALAALVIGVKDWATMTEAQFAEASAFLREVHRNVRLYWVDGTELAQAMAGGEVDLAWAWNETATVLAADGVPVAVNRDTQEGLSTWACGYVLLANGPGSEDRAYDYLNAILDPAVSSYMVTDWGYGHANAAGMAAMDPAALEASGLADVARFADKTLFQAPLPAELKARMIAEFEKIKAGF